MALPSIEYRGFAVAPMTLRAPSRKVVITSEITGRAMRAPTGDGGATDGCNDATLRCKHISQLRFSRDVVGARIARPPIFRALSKPRIQLRVQGRNPARFKGGYGVPRGFKGEKSKSPPNPLGLAERVPSSADDDSPVFRNLVKGERTPSTACGRSPSLEEGGLGERGKD